MSQRVLLRKVENQDFFLRSHAHYRHASLLFDSTRLTRLTRLYMMCTLTIPRSLYSFSYLVRPWYPDSPGDGVFDAKKALLLCNQTALSVSLSAF